MPNKKLLFGMTTALMSLLISACNMHIPGTSSNVGPASESTSSEPASTEPVSSEPTSETSSSTEESSSEPHAHVWDNGIITKFPSIYEEGIRTYHCQSCDETKTETIAKVNDATNYTLKATKMEGLPGAYTTKAVIGADKTTSTIGISLIAKENLVDYPTYESPGIIQGAAVNYEIKKGAVEYEQIPGKELIAPYEYFRYSITEVESKDADGNIRKYKKLSGFDGTYYFIRLDVSNIIANKTGYLHVKQESNKALMVLLAMQGGVDTGVAATDAQGQATTRPTIKEGFWYIGETNTNIKVEENHNESLAYAGANGNWFVGGTGFADGMGMKTASYSLKDNAAALKDKTGNYKDTPYIDIIVLSSGKLAAGADAGKETAPSSDIQLSMYVDDTLDNDPSLTYDPTSQDANHNANVMKKFFDETKAVEGTNSTSYAVKGSDLELDVVTSETVDDNDIDEFWSLTKAISYQQYNDHTIKLMCEVPVLEALEVKSENEDHRDIKFDVNSFDIQIANHSQTNAAGLTVSNNASLTLLDNSNTVGAELAIGNNAKMEILDGGTLVIDKTCQLEVEYDAASTVHDKTHYTVEQVIEKINALPEPANVKEADRVNINAAKDAYDALTQEEQAQVTNAQKLTDCLNALPPETPLTNGEITVKSGGKMINNGIINIEGLEIKPAASNPQEQSQEVIRDTKAASLLVEEGGTIDNNGCLNIKGDLYILGTLNNYGKFADLIQGNDPDKGVVNHHKGIQVTWKDDVTVLKEGSTTEYTVNPEVRPGTLHVGIDANKKIYTSAKVNNYGDIVLVPGTVEVYGSFFNIKNEDGSAGALYLCTVSEAVVPITPTQQDPTKLEERRQFTPPYESKFDIIHARQFINDGIVANAKVEIISNGIFGNLTVVE